MPLQATPASRDVPARMDEPPGPIAGEVPPPAGLDVLGPAGPVPRLEDVDRWEPDIGLDPPGSDDADRTDPAAPPRSPGTPREEVDSPKPSGPTSPSVPPADAAGLVSPANLTPEMAEVVAKLSKLVQPPKASPEMMGESAVLPESKTSGQDSTLAPEIPFRSPRTRAAEPELPDRPDEVVPEPQLDGAFNGAVVPAFEGVQGQLRPAGPAVLGIPPMEDVGLFPQGPAGAETGDQNHSELLRAIAELDVKLDRILEQVREMNGQMRILDQSIQSAGTVV